MVNNPSMVFTDVDYNAQGKQVDWLYLPHVPPCTAPGC